MGVLYCILQPEQTWFVFKMYLKFSYDSVNDMEKPDLWVNSTSRKGLLASYMATAKLP